MDTIIITLPAATMHITYDLKRGIEEVFASWERFYERSKNLQIVPVFDTTHDRYVLQEVDTKSGGHESRTLAHLEIKNGKIWIMTDNTEEGIGGELVSAGIPKSQIVLAFYPPDIREMGEFAVS